MKSERETLERLSAVSGVKMSAQKQQEIWDTIEKKMAYLKPVSNRKRRLNVLGTSLAAVIAVAIIAGGFYTFSNHVATGTNNLGSTTASNLENPNNNGTQQNSSITNQQSQRNPLFDTTLKLPNGQTITPSRSVRWKDLNVILQIQDTPVNSPRYLGIVGNQSTVLSHTSVSTSAGTATLVLNERTPPAAAQSTTPTYEYWVIVYRSQYAYAIEAVVIGNQNHAKSEIMDLLNNWKVSD